VDPLEPSDRRMGQEKATEVSLSVWEGEGGKCGHQGNWKKRGRWRRASEGDEKAYVNWRERVRPKFRFRTWQGTTVDAKQFDPSLDHNEEEKRFPGRA